ncbi:alkylated DNA repair protein (DNA oxidative demethylase) [Paucibacter oligotrophus]|uniref:Alkylated DNA repair protein (DNA oxidative demethylase) n=1 Tax=Roseateles oligotrophus TaxID=1769250 RepID=A0A840LAV3_9BURK|nr:DNA oxidative demethylase AlkB [Roseateles oligotrophus]MBB4845276.1 alkylated DNA repair protein (DNA oxidative demethylase) [Roseateles oligotrophus]
MNASLFDEPAEQAIAPGAVLLRGFALAASADLQAGVAEVLAQAPLRQMLTPGGKAMAVWMTNCGPLGWVSDRRGYRYQSTDPLSTQPWPALPPAFARLATDAAKQAAYAHFKPDACLINRYLPGTRLSLHQDRDEQDFEHPIVSVSLGLPAVFLFGGLSRGDKTQRLALQHGDVLVWGGPARLRFHGVMPLAAGRHAELGEQRINLTFRKAA